MACASGGVLGAARRERGSIACALGLAFMGRISLSMAGHIILTPKRLAGVAVGGQEPRFLVPRFSIGPAENGSKSLLQGCRRAAMAGVASRWKIANSSLDP